jgi:transcriptional regulator of acetoin/glycerol metabolism
MASAHADQQVRRWGERFRKDPVAAGVVLALRDRGDEIRRADGAAIRLVPQWAHQFSLAGDVQLRELSRTTHAFADCNFNVKQTARRLSIHTNTVYFRLNRITSLTGINPRTYSGTSHLLTALRLLEVHNGGRRL